MNAREKSSPIVVLKYSDPDLIRKALYSHFSRLRREHAEIKRGIWFGSWITGIPTPHSDVDLCLILTHSCKSFRDRLPDYLPSGFPVGVDLFPYTEEEFERLQADHPAWYRCIAAGLELKD